MFAPKRLCWVSFILILALGWSFWRAPAALAADSVGVLVNGGFEDGTYLPTGNPRGWYRDVYTSQGVQLVWDSATVRTGSRSVKISAAALNDARWVQTVEVQPNTVYRLSGWIKTENVTHSPEQNDVGANLSLLNAWAHSQPLLGTNDWTFVSLEFNTDSARQVTVAARLGFWGGTTTGTAWFDDLTLERITPALNPINLLANPGADDGPYPSVNLPEHWKTDAFYPGSAVFAWDFTQAHTGSRSAKISAATLNDVRWVQTVAVQPNTAYRISGWIKTENVTHSPEQNDVGANLSLLNAWAHSQPLLGTNGWTFVSFGFTTGSETQVTIAARLGFWSGMTTGTAWFDEIKLEAVDNPPVRNGSFEEGVYVVNGPPSGWKPREHRSGEALFGWDQTESYAGSRSLRLELAQRSTAAWEQRVSVQPNRDYQLSGWIKTRGVTQAGPRGHHGAHLEVSEAEAISGGVFGTQGWTYVTLTFNSRDRTAVTVGARLGDFHEGLEGSIWSAEGSVWFDELRLAPVDPGPHPRWTVLVLIYGTTDFSYTDSQGGRHRVVATMTQEERERAAVAARRFVNVDVPALTSGNMYPSLTIRYPERPLAALDPYVSGTWWPSPGNTASERSAAFDSVIVIWDPDGVDQVTGQRVYLAGAGGLTPPMGTGQTYAAITLGGVAYNNRNIFKHEWGHSLTFYFDAAGTAPRPPVNNHINATDTRYVHCSTGLPYILQDENDDALIPNSIYNNDSGFTHDYYSGTTATPDQPARCLGITPAAWAAGGPVSKATSK